MQILVLLAMAIFSKSVNFKSPSSNSRNLNNSQFRFLSVDAIAPEEVTTDHDYPEKVEKFKKFKETYEQLKHQQINFSVKIQNLFATLK